MTGAGQGVGRGIALAFANEGADLLVAELDPDTGAAVAKEIEARGARAHFVACDVTRRENVETAVAEAVGTFGGIDILVSNAGAFPASCRLDELGDEELERSLALNFSSHQKLIRESAPFLKLGFDASIVVVASKNVPAPGPGAGAYSTAKAALTQLARVAALELGPDGIRVNVIHPNAVFDTGVWTEDVLRNRADHYGLSVEAYKTNNVLKVEVTSADVADMTVALSGRAFARTTGAQIAVDGGNERVI